MSGAVASTRGALGITGAFQRKGKEVFVAYLTAGFPTRSETVPALLALQESGASIIEVGHSFLRLKHRVIELCLTPDSVYRTSFEQLGVPFSDPMADGGTIQKANQVALENHVTVSDCIQFVRDARSQGLTVPLVFMGA